jgi:hypothetical protein
VTLCHQVSQSSGEDGRWLASISRLPQCGQRFARPGGADGDLMELNGWTSPQMLARTGPAPAPPAPAAATTASWRLCRDPAAPAGWPPCQAGLQVRTIGTSRKRSGGLTMMTRDPPICVVIGPADRPPTARQSEHSARGAIRHQDSGRGGAARTGAGGLIGGMGQVLFQRAGACGSGARETGSRLRSPGCCRRAGAVQRPGRSRIPGQPGVGPGTQRRHLGPVAQHARHV